jgi:radical SAM superfamily enzyme YgiQ (UPF0313 family)
MILGKGGTIVNYEGQICRSPMERGSFMLPVAVGCSHNRCRFCMLFKHLTYRILPLDLVKAEIDRIVNLGGNPQRIFLGDGNAFSLPASHLATILNWCCEAFPGLCSVSMDAHVRNILIKSDAELAALQKLKLTDLYLGIECGLEDVLLKQDKGNTLAEAELAIQRLHGAGIEYDAHIMTGICGRGRWQENAAALAGFFNRTMPKRICNFSLFIHRESLLYQDMLHGSFHPADELETLQEELALLKQLHGFACVYDGLHDFVPAHIRGNLPEDQEKMCRHLIREIHRLEADPSLIKTAIV